VIPKPEPNGEFIVKGWGVRRGERALIYTIPNWKPPARPHEKGITEEEWVIAAMRLTTADEFAHSWFKQFMPACYSEGTCNFTTIGGIFVLFKYAAYEARGMYRRLPDYEGEDRHSSAA
jgi:hypothetical protein